MPLSLQHRHAVLLADRTRDVRTITTVVTEVLAASYFDANCAGGLQIDRERQPRGS
jgi:hypothetical protein